MHCWYIWLSWELYQSVRHNTTPNSYDSITYTLNIFNGKKKWIRNFKSNWSIIFHVNNEDVTKFKYSTLNSHSNSLLLQFVQCSIVLLNDTVGHNFTLQTLPFTQLQTKARKFLVIVGQTLNPIFWALQWYKYHHFLEY